MNEQEIRAIVRDEIAKAASGPGHDPTGEGSARQMEAPAKSAGPVVPAGWVECKGHHPSDSRQILHPKTRHIIAWASPNRCVPWGEGYEAILPDEAERGDEYLAGSEWVAPLDPPAWSAEARMAEVWRRKVQPEVGSLADRVADSLADDVQRMQVAIETLTDERDRLRAEVERLKAESTVAAVSVLVDHARGVLMHRYEGACPDSVEGPDVRDPECPVCRAIDSVSRLRTIGPGEVVVDAAELAGLRAFADGWSSFRDQFNDIPYHYQGMGCGIEDRGITDRYAACEHGWDCAMERVAERFPEIDTLDALRSQKECQP